MENLVLQSGGGVESLRQWVKTEHYRLHCAEEWPDSPYKEAVLAAARSALERLEVAVTDSFDLPACSVCAARRTPAAKVLMFPSQPKKSHVVLKPAA